MQVMPPTTPLISALADFVINTKILVLDFYTQDLPVGIKGTDVDKVEDKTRDNFLPHKRGR